MRRSVAVGILVVILVGLLGTALYYLPPIHDRLAWRVEALIADIRYAIFPPEQVVFVPQVTALLATPDRSATAAYASAVLASPSPTSTQTPPAPGPTATLTLSPTPSLSPTPLPAQIQLTGIVHEYQLWNNCGPANLSMALSYWDWPGDQRDTAAYLKPNPRDKNVMPYEMVGFVQEKTGLKALVRYGGNLQLLKTFLSQGFPVIVEKGFEGAGFSGWMGHYEVISGYDDDRQRLTAQDSYIQANLPVPYADLEKAWRAFNYTYIVIYPVEREAEVQAILGPQWDETANYRYAAQLASDEIYALTDRDQFFAWYNRGASLVYLEDYGGAAAAFDQAFALYPQIPEKSRPWRMLWYQTGPYFAYYGAQRYYDLLSLATQTIDNATEPAIEESFYWRARAYYELYLLEGKEDYKAYALEDFQASLKWHPDFGPTLYQMSLLGLAP